MRFSHFSDIKVDSDNEFYSFLPRSDSLFDSTEQISSEEYQQFGFIQHATTIDAARNILRYYFLSWV